MKITITINTKNDMFVELEEMTALNEVINHLNFRFEYYSKIEALNGMKIRDMNGNIIGDVRVS